MTSNPEIVYIDQPGKTGASLQLFSKAKVVYVDSETNGLDPFVNDLHLIQITDSKAEKILVLNFWSMTPADKMCLREFFEAPRELVIHNASFDLKFFYTKFGLEPEKTKVFDTKLTESVLVAGFPTNLRGYTSLKNTVHRRLGIELDKEVRMDFVGQYSKTFSKRQITYSAKDVAYLPEIRKQQINEAKEHGLIPTLKLEFELVKHLTRIELNGIDIDTGLWESIILEQEILREESYAKLYTLLKPYLPQQGLFEELPFNINSNEQLLNILNSGVGLKLEDTAEQNLKMANHPICDQILDYREHEKILSAFGKSTLAKVNPVTHRLHPEYNQCYTATGRFSSDNPNIQQIPGRGEGSKLRKCFKASPGFKMVCGDYSQIELRILAELSGEESMINAYEEGFDGHTNTAAVAFGVPHEEVTPEQRKVAKILNFATVYGGGPTAISKGLLQVLDEKTAQDLLAKFGKKPSSKGVFFDLAREFLATFFQGMPKAKEYLDEMGNRAIELRYSETPLGRKRFYHYELDKDGLTIEELKSVAGSVRRRGMNHPIQGCSADITKLAIIKLAEAFDKAPELEGRILIQVHDEIISEVKEGFAEVGRAVQDEAMIEAAREWLKTVPVEADIKNSDYWSK